jgi:hypothetical protein
LTAPPPPAATSIITANPLANTTYTQKVIQQMANDKYHGFPRIVDNYGGTGKIQNIIGGDGVARIKLTIEGSLNGKNGIFEYIIEPNNMINHRLFVPY